MNVPITNPLCYQSELNINGTLNGIASEQAGLQSGSNFHITDFNYGVSVVANLIQKYIEDTDFISVSVSIALGYHLNHELIIIPALKILL